MIVGGCLPLLPAASSPFVSELCPPSAGPSRPPPGLMWTAVSRPHGLADHFWFSCTLSSAPGHPHLLEVLRDAGRLTEGAPSCWEESATPAFPPLCCTGLLPSFPVEKRETETAGLPAPSPPLGEPRWCKFNCQAFY